MGTSASERWLGTPPKFVGMRGHGRCETNFSSRCSKDWTQKQVHRFQIKRKINEFVFYHFHCIYRRCFWQHGNRNNWFTMQRWPNRKYKNSGLLDLYSKHTDTRTFPAIYSYALKMVSVFRINCLMQEAFFKAWRMLNPKQRAQTTNIHLENWPRISTWQIKADMDRLLNNKHCQISH